MKISFPDRLRKIIWFSAKRYSIDNHSQRAVALTYYTIFAIVPMAALLFGIAKGFDLDVKLRNELTQQLYQHKEILEWVCKFADTTLKKAKGGIVAGVGVAALMWTVLWLASNVEKAFNDVWGLPTRKNIFRRFSDYLALLLLTPLALVIVGGAGVTLQKTFDWLAARSSDLGHGLPVIFTLSADLAPLIMAITLFTLIYKCAPNTKVRISSALLAGIIAGLLFQLLQNGFLVLQTNIFKYNHIYGTFAVLPLFLIWMQWSWQIALFGAEIGFVSQNIDSGIFDGQGNLRESMRRRRTNQLAAAALIYRNFFDGKGGTTLDEAVTKLNLPGIQLDAELQELLEKKIIFAVTDSCGEVFYTPAMPTEELTAAGCLRILDGAGESVSGETPVLEEVSRVFAAFDGQTLNTPADLLLRDLVRK